jgi:hypothetical protein
LLDLIVDRNQQGLDCCFYQLSAQLDIRLADNRDQVAEAAHDVCVAIVKSPSFNKLRNQDLLHKLLRVRSNQL